MAAGELTPSQRRTSLAAVLTSAVASGMTIGMATPLVALTMAAAGHGGFLVGLNAAAQALTVLASANTTLIMAYTAGMVAGPALGGAAMELWRPHGLLPALALPALLFLWVIFRGRPWRRAKPAEG